MPKFSHRHALYVICYVVNILFLMCHAATAQFITGTYTGNSTDNRAITQVGFQPDVVLIKGDTGQEAVIRTSSMLGDNAKQMIGGDALKDDLIQSLDWNGFTLGSNNRVNDSGRAYYWMAWQAVDGEVAVGSYTGTGTDDRTIDVSDTSSSADFQPDYVIVMSAEGRETLHRSSATTGQTTFEFDSTTRNTNNIQALLANGFQVGTDDRVNKSGETYHYVAWKSVAGKVGVGSYIGNENDNRNITALGFQPEYVILRSDNGHEAVHRSASQGSGNDDTMYFTGSSNDTNHIQALQFDGFQVGSNDRVNEDEERFFWIAFARQAPPTAVTMRKVTASAYEGGILLRWQTSMDINNLGWHIYREVNGKRVQLTPGLIAGSALVFGPGIRLNAGNAYRWWDPSGTDTDRYWLGDQDASGKLTMHGPVTPVVMDQPPPKNRRSALLSQVGRKQTSWAKAHVTTPKKRRQHQRRPVVRHKVTSSQTLQPWEQPDLPPDAVQYALAAASATKLDVWQRGWYRVTQPELVAAGLDPNVDPRRLQFFVGGRQQPIMVTGEDDGRFDAQDAIEFYGVGIDTPWTDTQTYWLVAGSQPGKRMYVESNQTQGAEPPQSFPFTVERKDYSLYLAMVKNGEASNFYGAVIAKDPVEQALTLHHLDPSPLVEAQLEVALQGVTTGAHQVIIQLNGHDVGTMAFTGQVREVVTFPISHAWLQNGENIITLIPIDDEGASVVDAIRMTHSHTYAADQDTLRFMVPGQSQVTITGFSQPDIRVVDITNPQATRELIGDVTAQGAHNAITVTATGEDERILLAFTAAQVKHPVTIRANAPSSWHQPIHAADLVIISHGMFMDHVTPLKTMRKSQGWSVAVIDVQDVYDAFNYGAKSPWALRHFLHHASTAWQTPPRFVLLVGDASFDPRNHLELDDVDFIPTRFVPTAFMETASDNWLVDFDDNGVPELAIGRLPVQTVEEATTVMAKLVGYAQASNHGMWTREALLVADKQDGFDFAAANEDVATALSPTLSVESLLLDATDVTRVRDTLLTRLNEGKLLVNYMGHGSTEVWANGELLTSTDALALTNRDKLPVVVAMNCLNGFFHDLYTTSLAEALLKAEQGGAVAVWASSGLTGPSGQSVMNRALMQALFGQDELTLGEAIMRAKATVTNRDIQRTWLLFGDPTMRLK